jgi:hypothetical protein
MQAKTVGQQTRNRDLVIPARASRSTFLCGLCALCGEFFFAAREEDGRWCYGAAHGRNPRRISSRACGTTEVTEKRCRQRLWVNKQGTVTL